MATGGLYGQSSAGIVSPQSGSESSGLYGNNTVFGGTYFEWFIFQVSDVQPDTPTGGSWSFTTNSGTPPTGWLATPPANPTNTVWVSVGIVNSKSTTPIVWSTPGKFSFASGLPILSGASAPVSGDGQSDQLYIETGTTPETIWFKQAGTWTRLTGSSLYMDLTSNQTIAGTKTFSSEIQGSVSGTSSNVSGIVDITHGGTGSTTASAARAALGVTATGQDTTYAYRANNLSDLASASTSRTNLGLGTAAVLTAGAANGVATLDSGGTVPLSQIPASIQGGVSYQGTWNASTNSPTLTSSVGSKGYYYVVSTAGSTNLNGVTDWNIGDWAIFNGTVWQKIDNTDAVTSVNGYTGTVVLNASDVGALASITSTDGSITVSQVGTAVDLAVSAASPASTLLLQVRNNSGATMTKGTVVYVNGAVGQLPTIAKALATSDATSAQTQGLVTADISNNSNGYVTIIGLVTGLDTSAYSDGEQLYLSGVTAGAMTATKQYAPIHLVYVGVVTHAHPTQGKIQVKVQNGYELDELHNVSAQTPSNGQTIVYNSSTGLWANNTVSLTAGVNGTLPITSGGTGQTTANAAFNALAPSQTGNSGKYLTTDGSNTSWATNPLGTVTSVDASGGTTGLTFSGGPITTSGTLTLAGTLAVANGGTGITSFGTGVATALGTNVGTAGSFVVNGGALGTPSSGTVTNLTGTASININGTVGATTPTTGAFTTLSASGVTTLSAGSASAPALTTSGDTNTGVLFPAADTVAITTGGTERARVDSSGNLGLGVTPSAWSIGRAIEVYNAGSGFLSNGANNLYTTSNAFYNSGWKYGATGTASYYSQNSGSHIWATAPSGTAGNAITFTQAMTLDASGNLGVGTTSPAGILHAKSSGNYGSVIIDTSSSTGGGNFVARQNGSNKAIFGVSGSIEGNTSSDAGVFAETGGAIRFYTNGSATERARIDSSGNLLVGTTGQISSSKVAVSFSGATYNGLVLSESANTSNTTYLTFNNGSTIIGSVTRVGSTSAVIYNTTSDYRLKTVIGAVSGAGERIDALEPIEYAWNSDGSRTRGFLAHKFQEVYAGSVSGTKDAVDEQGNPVYQSMQAGSSEVIADLVSEIQSLRKRLAAAGIA